MSLERVNKDFPAVRTTPASINKERIDDIQREDSAREADEPSISGAIPRTKMGQFFFAESKDIQAGPTLKFKEPLLIDNIKRSDIININESCNNCKREEQQKTIRGKIEKVKRKLTVQKCLILAIIVIFIEILVLAYFYSTAVREDNAQFIKVSKIDTLHGNLIKFRTPDFRADFVDFGIIDCAHYCPKLKSKIRFVLMKMNYFRCRDCGNDMLTRFVESPTGYRDIYYNYIISYNGIEEGRSLTCPFDEPFLEEDHSFMITVGIEYCYPGRSQDNLEASLKVTDLISDLITNLKEQDILNKDYVLDFPDICEKSLLLERIRRVTGIGRTTFYRSELYKNLNISTKLNPTMTSQLLFLPKDTMETESASSSRIKLQFPFNISIGDIDYSTVVSGITLRFYYISWFEVDPDQEAFRKKFWKCSHGQTFLINCWPIIITFLGEEISGFDRSIGNYYLFEKSDVVYGQIPVNYRSNLNGSELIVNVFLVYYDYGFKITEEKIIWLSQVLESIGNHVWKRINYSHVDYQVSCDFVPDYYPSVLHVYQHMVERNMGYIKFSESGYFTFVPTCKPTYRYAGDKLIPKIKSMLLFLPKKTVKASKIKHQAMKNYAKSSPKVKLEFPFSTNVSIHNTYYSSDAKTVTLRFYFLDLSDLKLDKNFTKCSSGKAFSMNCWPRIMSYLDEEGLNIDASLGNYYVFNYLDVVYGQIPANYSSNLNDSDLVINVVQSYYDTHHQNSNRIMWFAQVLDSIRNDVEKRINYSRVIMQFVCPYAFRYYTAYYIYCNLLHEDMRYVIHSAPGDYEIVDKCPPKYG